MRVTLAVKVTVDEVGLGMNKKDGDLRRPSQNPAVALTPARTVQSFGGFRTKLLMPELSHQKFRLSISGGALASGFKSSPGNSNAQPNLLITEPGNEPSAGISENPTGKTEGILIDYVID